MSLVLPQIMGAAQGLGIVPRDVKPLQATIPPLTEPSPLRDGLQSGIPGLVKAAHAGTLTVNVRGVLDRAATDQIGSIPEGDLLHALRVLQRLRDLGRLGYFLMEEGLKPKVWPAIDDPNLKALFDRQRFADRLPREGFLVEMRNPGFDPFTTPGGGEVLWITSPADLGGLGDAVAPYWSGDPLGMVLYRNRRLESVGAIMVYGAMQNHWNTIHSGGWQSLGGVMCFSGQPLGTSLATVTDKAMAMIKWMPIQARLARLGHPESHSVNLGPAKSICLFKAHESLRPEQVLARKYGALAFHARMMRLHGIYIGGNDEGVGEAEAGLIASLAPKNFAGAPTSFPKYRGRFPSPYTGDGVTEALLVALEHHVGDLNAPIVMLGYGGVGQRMTQNAIALGLNVTAVVETNLESLLRAHKSGTPAENCFFLIEGRGDAIQGQVDQARSLGFQVAENLVDALDKMGEVAVVCPNGGAHAITREVLETAHRKGIRALVGAANNLFAEDNLAWLALQYDILVFHDSTINSLGATVVLADAIALTDVAMERHVLAIGEEAFYALCEGHRKGIPPLFLGLAEAGKLWNRFRDEGLAIGARYPDTIPPRPEPSI